MPASTIDGPQGTNATSTWPSPFSFLLATRADLEAITQIHIEGFVEDPQLEYRYPYRNEYPEDYQKWTRRMYESYLDH